MSEWCGPSVIATVINTDYKNAKAICDEVSLKSVTGTTMQEVQLTFHRFGWQCRNLKVDNPSSKIGYPYPKFNEWYNRQSIMDKCQPMIIALSDHWISVKMGMVLDNKYKKSTPIEKTSYANRKMSGAFIVYKRSK